MYFWRPSLAMNRCNALTSLGDFCKCLRDVQFEQFSYNSGDEQVHSENTPTPLAITSHSWCKLCYSLPLRSPKCLSEHTLLFGTFISLSYRLFYSWVSVALSLQSPVQRSDHTDAMTTEKWVLLVTHLGSYVRACSPASAVARTESSTCATTCLIQRRALTKAAVVRYQCYLWNKQFCSDTVNSYLQLPKFF